MKRLYLTLALLAGMLASSAYAVEPAAKGQRFEPAKTRQEAITRAKEYVAKLEAMSDKDWEAKRAERLERFKQRQARMQERRNAAAKAAPAAGTPATAAPAPATKPAQ